jgi:hypothetical protein
MNKFLTKGQNVTITNNNGTIYNGYIQYVSNTVLVLSYFDSYFHKQSKLVLEGYNKVIDEIESLVVQKINALGIASNSLRIEF